MKKRNNITQRIQEIVQPASQQVDCTVPLSRFSRGQLSATLWTAHQAPLSMEFSRQEYWSGLPCPPPGDLPNPGIEPRSLALQADSGSCATREALAVSVMSKMSILVAFYIA